MGRIPFLVCAPFFHASLGGLPGIRFVDGHPRKLNALLASGDIDCAPSSSFEYARNPVRYFLLPGLCTSGRGEVGSALFFSRRPWENIDGRSVALSAESDTSNVLFRVLCRFRFGVTPELRAADEGGDPEIEGRVMIGDAALREARIGNWPHRYDLAGIWESWRGNRLPFGLWMVRADAWENRRAAMVGYREHLLQSVSAFFAAPSGALETWDRAYPMPLPPAEALAFFPTKDYELGPSHEEALHIFFGLCREAGWLNADPPLRFARA